MTPPVKTCFKCGQEKPITEFYKHPKMGDGYLGKCKECTKADARGNRANNITYYRDYDKQRAMLPKRVEARNAYAKTDVSKEYKYEYLKQYRKNNPEKWAAHAAVRNALKTGRLKKSPCEVCGNEKSVVAHHHDYSKPLDVIWLCHFHHRQVHTQSAS